jgi:OOP family OmpA-OmpF porin
MPSTSSSFRSFALLALLALAANASAQDTRGGYIGASIGQAYYKHTCDGASAGITCNNNDTSMRLFGGYQWKPSFAMEVGLHALGNIAAQGTGPGTVTQTAEVRAVDLVYVGSWAMANRFSLVTKLGLYFGKVQVDSTPAGTSRGWESRKTNDITYGLGVGYALTDHADFRFEWQHFGHFGTGSPPALDIHLVSLGALYRF